MISVSGAVNEGSENNFFPSSFLLENGLLNSISFCCETYPKILSQKRSVWGCVRFDDENDLLRLGDMPQAMAPILNC